MGKRPRLPLNKEKKKGSEMYGQQIACVRMCRANTVITISVLQNGENLCVKITKLGRFEVEVVKTFKKKKNFQLLLAPQNNVKTVTMQLLFAFSI